MKIDRRITGASFVYDLQRLQYVNAIKRLNSYLRRTTSSLFLIYKP